MAKSDVMIYDSVFNNFYKKHRSTTSVYRCNYNTHQYTERRLYIKPRQRTDTSVTHECLFWVWMESTKSDVQRQDNYQISSWGCET